MKLFKIKTESNDLIGTKIIDSFVSALNADKAIDASKQAHKEKQAHLSNRPIFVKEIKILADSENFCEIMPRYIQCN